MVPAGAEEPLRFGTDVIVGGVEGTLDDVEDGATLGAVA